MRSKRFNNKNSKTPRIRYSYYFFFAFTLFPFLAPYYLLQHKTWGLIIDYWVYLSIIILLFFTFKHNKKISISILLIVAIYFLLNLTTLWGYGDSIAVAKHSIKVILFCCLVNITKNDDKMMLPLLYAVRDITAILFIANLITCIIWNSGIPSLTEDPQYPYHLFGNVNTTIRIVLPGMLCSSLINHRNGKKFNAISIIYLIGFLYVYIAVYPTATTLIATLIITAWILLEAILSKISPRIFLYFVYMILALELAIVVLSNSDVIHFVTGLFNKSSDFTGRAQLWSRAMNSMQNHPIFGSGRQSLADIKMAIGNASGSHNYYLDILYQRGLIGFTLLLALIFKPAFKIKKSLIEHKEGVYILMGYCMSLLAMFLSEPFFEYEYYFIPIFYALYLYACTSSKTKSLNYKKCNQKNEINAHESK